MFEAVANGQDVPSELLGELLDSSALISDGAALRERLSEDGYVYLAGALDKSDVATAREETFRRLLDMGEIRESVSEGIVTGKSNRRELAGDLGAFWRSVSEGKALRRVTHGRQLKHLARVAARRTGDRPGLSISAGSTRRAGDRHSLRCAVLHPLNGPGADLLARSRSSSGRRWAVVRDRKLAQVRGSGQCHEGLRSDA